MRKNVIRRGLLIFCGVILGLNLYMTNANTLVGNKLPMPFGYGAAVVLSGSMEPTLSINDLIVVREIEKFTENDVVVYQDVKDLVVHRVVQIDGDVIVTKGDANSGLDEPIHVENILGKVVFSIPAVGGVVNFIKTPVGTVLVLLTAFFLVEMSNREERKKDDEEMMKIREEIARLKNEK